MDRVCPLLALAADRRTAVDGVDAGHRCHALEPPAPLERERQSQLCLTTAHQRCERYLAFLARADRPPTAELPIGDGLRSTRLILTPEPSWRGMAGRAGRSPRSAATVGLIAVLALGGATAVAAGIVPPRETATVSPTDDPTPRPTRSPSPSATPAATAEPTPAPSAAVATATPGVTPPLATPAPTAQPTPQRTYVVQAGDTLALIAQQFGVSVESLQAANAIADPNQILIGQVLVIP